MNNQSIIKHTNQSWREEEATFIIECEKIKTLCKKAQNYIKIKKVHDIFEYSLAKKIISPLTRKIELDGIPEELIETVKTIANIFKTFTFPTWFSDHDRRKRVSLELVFCNTLEISTFWSMVPFTKFHVLAKSLEDVSCFIIDIFQAVYPRYLLTFTITAFKPENM
jgi:hypothetical protein